MPKGHPTAGYRQTKRYKVKTVQELEQDIQGKAPRLVEELEKLTKPIECPGCGTLIHVIDKDVAMYLIDHAIGKSKSRTEVDLTTNIQLNADQIDQVIHNHLPQIVELYRSEIMLLTESTMEGEYKEIPDDIVKDRW